MRRNAARRADEQHRERRRRGERAFLLAPDGRCVGEGGLDDWAFAVSISGGDVVRAAAVCGMEVPRGTRALWGKSQQAAIDTYRRWLKRSKRG